jgi:hypothetical protein
MINNCLTSDNLFGIDSSATRVIIFLFALYNASCLTVLHMFRAHEHCPKRGTFHADSPTNGRFSPMASKKNVVSAMVGFAMLALPASALAGHHDWDDHPWPYALHDQGLHRGWLKHHGKYPVRPIEDEDEQGEHRHYTLHYQSPPFLCDADSDDCGPTNRGYGYRPPVSYYRAEPPDDYGLIQQRNWLIPRRRAADGGYIPALPYYGAAPNSNYTHDPSSAYSQNYAYGANPAFNPDYGTSPTLSTITGMQGSLLGRPLY